MRVHAIGKTALNFIEMTILKKYILKNQLLLSIAIKLIQYNLKKTKNITFHKNVFITLSNRYEGNNSIASNSSLSNSFLGYGTYLGSNCSIKNTKIGRFTSIGQKVNCIFGKHPSNTFVSTHPAFFSTRKQAGFTFAQEQLFEEFEPPHDNEGNYTITIGNDVWIGDGVSIMDGVRISDGAIVAAHALVVQDVPPYTVVGGIPAKPIKKRFSDIQIAFLLDFKWWNKDLNWIESNAKEFADICKFFNKYKNE